MALLRTTDWTDPASGETGLELGGGTGNLTALLAAAGANMTVVEQSQEMLNVLRKRLPAVETRLGNLLTLPITGKSFHFIVCSFAIRHLDRNQQLLALAEADRLLLPHGRLVITDRIADDSMMEAWLNGRGYSIVTEPMDGGLTILYAVKP
nr:class I SAM-dependent methyltransferase [Paenibacillus sp. NEAU-GSW1]